MGIRLRSVPLCHLPSVAPLFVCAVAAVVSVAAVIAVFRCLRRADGRCSDGGGCGCCSDRGCCLRGVRRRCRCSYCRCGLRCCCRCGCRRFRRSGFRCRVASAASVVGVAVFAVLSVTAFAVVAAFRISVAAFVVAPPHCCGLRHCGDGRCAAGGVPAAGPADRAVPAGLQPAVPLPANPCPFCPAPFAAAPLAAALGLIETGDTVLLRTVGRLFGRRGYVLGSLQPVYLLAGAVQRDDLLTRAMESVVTLTIASLLDEKVIVPARMSFLTR